MAEALGIVKAELLRNPTVHGSQGRRARRSDGKMEHISVPYSLPTMDVVGVVVQRKMSAMRSAKPPEV